MILLNEGKSLIKGNQNLRVVKKNFLSEAKLKFEKTKNESLEV
jgi:hypothetical protein